MIGSAALALALLVGARPLRAAPPSGLPGAGVRVAVQLRLARDSCGRESTRGVLTLTVPLERLLPRPIGLQQGPAGGMSSPASDSIASTVGSAAGPGPGGVAAGAVGSTPLKPGPDRLAILLDPDLGRKTVAAALRAAGFGASSRRLASLSSRARSSAALPELRLRGGRDTDESLRLSPTSSDPYRYTESGQTELFFEARLTWRLDRLLFSEAELRIERLRRQRAQAKARLVERVLELLFAWQRARTRLATATLLPEERALVALEQVEAETMLDVFTDGWFTARDER